MDLVRLPFWRQNGLKQERRDMLLFLTPGAELNARPEEIGVMVDCVRQSVAIQNVYINQVYINQNDLAEK